MTTEAKWSDFASLNGARTLAAANRLLPAWVCLLLVVAVAWQLARIVWMLVPGPSAGDPVQAPAGQFSAASPSQSGVDVQAIAGVHLFGEASRDDEIAEDTGPGPEGTPEKETELPLVLKGTIASPYEDLSAAIIVDNAGEENVYLIGGPVSPRANLHAVYPDHVVLNENGQLTSLSLPEEFANNPQPTVRRTPTTNRRTAANARSIQSVVSNNVARLADVIRPTPYFVNGQQQGYRVYPGRDRRQFAALGLRPGDLIKDIDGQSLSDPTQAMQIFQSLGNADQVSVTVERDGNPEVIVLKTDQLDLGDEKSR